MSINSVEFNKLWKGPVIRTGIITVAIPMFMCFLPSLYLYVAHGVFPDFGTAMKAWGMIATIYGAFYVVEPISYYPILGLTGTYVSFLSGNISNLRVPCSAIAQEAVGAEAGTPEGEIASTLGLCGSVITNLFFVSLAAVAGAALLGLLPEWAQNGFKLYTTPAIFGAMLGQFGSKVPILIPVAVIIPFFMLYLAPLMGLSFLATPWVVIIVAVFGTIGIARAFYAKGIIK